MIQTTISIDKFAVYDEVAKTTAYTGAKQTGSDETSYDRLLTTDEDRQMLERFWVEACDAATTRMKRFVAAVSTLEIGDGATTATYSLTLELPSRWPIVLGSAVKAELQNFLTALITAKWLTVAGSDRADIYASLADTKLQNATRLLYHRGKPTHIPIS